MSNHLRRVIEGTVASDVKTLTKSLEKLSAASEIQKSKLLTYRHDTERLVGQIKATDKENQLLKKQIEGAKEKITNTQKEYRVKACAI